MHRGGHGFLQFISGLIGLALTLALLLGLAFLAYRLADKKGLFKRGHRGPGGHGGHHAEPGAPHQQPGPWDAMRILDERLARGEVDIDDYKARRDALTGNTFPPFHQPPPPPPAAPQGAPRQGTQPPSGDPLADKPQPPADEHPPHVPPPPQ